MDGCQPEGPDSRTVVDPLPRYSSCGEEFARSYCCLLYMVLCTITFSPIPVVENVDMGEQSTHYYRSMPREPWCSINF